MRTFKRNVVVLGESDSQLEVQAGDVTITVEMAQGNLAGQLGVVRVRRPRTDGRHLHVGTWKSGAGEPEVADACHNVEVIPFDEEAEPEAVTEANVTRSHEAMGNQ